MGSIKPWDASWFFCRPHQMQWAYSKLLHVSTSTDFNSRWINTMTAPTFFGSMGPSSGDNKLGGSDPLSTYKFKLRKVRNEKHQKCRPSEMFGTWFAKMDADCTQYALMHGQKEMQSAIASKLMAFENLESLRTSEHTPTSAINWFLSWNEERLYYEHVLWRARGMLVVDAPREIQVWRIWIFPMIEHKEGNAAAHMSGNEPGRQNASRCHMMCSVELRMKW